MLLVAAAAAAVSVATSVVDTEVMITSVCLVKSAKPQKPPEEGIVHYIFYDGGGDRHHQLFLPDLCYHQLIPIGLRTMN